MEGLAAAVAAQNGYTQGLGRAEAEGVAVLALDDAQGAHAGERAEHRIGGGGRHGGAAVGLGGYPTCVAAFEEQFELAGDLEAQLDDFGGVEAHQFGTEIQNIAPRESAREQPDSECGEEKEYEVLVFHYLGIAAFQAFFLFFNRF
jgi:hypothetical protein